MKHNNNLALLMYWINSQLYTYILETSVRASKTWPWISNSICALIKSPQISQLLCKCYPDFKDSMCFIVFRLYILSQVNSAVRLLCLLSCIHYGPKQMQWENTHHMTNQRDLQKPHRFQDIFPKPSLNAKVVTVIICMSRNYEICCLHFNRNNNDKHLSQKYYTIRHQLTVMQWFRLYYTHLEPTVADPYTISFPHSYSFIEYELLAFTDMDMQLHLKHASLKEF